MHDLRSTGWNLVIVKRGKNILRIAPIDSVAFTVQHIDVHVMSPRIELVARAEPATPANNPVTAGHFRVDPDFVGIDRSLAKGMPEL